MFKNLLQQMFGGTSATISLETFEELMKTQQALLIDVRQEDEYRQGHIERAKLLPLALIKQNISRLTKDKQRPLIVYCQTGIRSSQAVRILSQLGYENVHDLGGIISYKGKIVR